MSIEMENPKTLLEKIDAAAAFVEQMHIAHRVRNEELFSEAHKRAGDLLFDAVQMAGEI